MPINNPLVGLIALLTTIIIFFFNAIKNIIPNNKIKLGGMEPKQSQKIGLFIFHRDLRIVDNTSLIELSKKVDKIIPLFIFDDRQIVSPCGRLPCEGYAVITNQYKSNPCVNFMIESLRELADDIKARGGILNFIKGNTIAIIKQIIESNKINVVAFTLDYTPFAKSRDNEIIGLCDKLKIAVITSHDCLLLSKPVSKENGEIYKVFTPFHNAFKNEKIIEPNTYKITNFSDTVLDGSFETIEDIAIRPDKDFKPAVKGGRINGLKQLDLVKNQKEYNKNRNTLSYNTTHLSAYNKFGNVSVREVYATFAKLPNGGSDLIKQLFWRDFYYNIMNSDPNALNGNFNPKFDKVKWNNDESSYGSLPLQGSAIESLFDAWKSGNTGFPIVDACMRELNASGIMHNRGRMIVADFLIKLLRIDWRKGEKYFATHLIDYDPAMNNYNWQWVAGTGPFSQPYFRVFNPWAQSEKYDSECEYIYKWIPLLKGVPAKKIHNWSAFHGEFKDIAYPAPIIDYEKAREAYLKEINL
jgi:deoxyribodipyrimidine photo-lyase